MFKSLVVLALVGAAAAIGPTWTSVEDTPTLSHRTATALSLSWLAYFGIDRFYMGYLIVGGLKALTLGGFGIWALVDAIFVSHCWLLDNWGRVLDGCKEEQNMFGPVRADGQTPRAGEKEAPTMKEKVVAADDKEKVVAADDAAQF